MPYSFNSCPFRDLFWLPDLLGIQLFKLEFRNLYWDLYKKRKFSDVDLVHRHFKPSRVKDDAQTYSFFFGEKKGSVTLLMESFTLSWLD